jgi:hypothetical protein
VQVERFLVGKRRARLSRAALETLATIAYRQPITRGEIEEFRGVDSGHVVNRLLERDLITVRGRSEALGRPLLYGTTTEFLRYFGVTALSDLPALEEFEALGSDDPLDDPEIREALENEGLWSQDEDLGDIETAMRAEAVPDDVAVSSASGFVGETDDGPVSENDTTFGNGHDPANGNGHHAENGHDPANGNGHHAENGHDPANGNGHRAENGHDPANGNGDAVGHRDHLHEDHDDRGESGHTAGHEGGDERSQVERSADGAFVPETAVSAELEPPSFGDDEDELEAESEDPVEWDDAERAEAATEGDSEASR